MSDYQELVRIAAAKPGTLEWEMSRAIESLMRERDEARNALEAVAEPRVLTKLDAYLEGRNAALEEAAAAIDCGCTGDPNTDCGEDGCPRGNAQIIRALKASG